MRLIVFGTGPFCVPTLTSLLESKHQILAVVTRPIDNAGKRRKTAANPVLEIAKQSDLVVLDPVSCNLDQTIKQLSELGADLFFVCDYGQILSKKCLASARLGGINLHGSLLPKYRGAAPVQWAIYNGETEVGVTVIHMTTRLDAGPSLANASIEIDCSENASQIESRLSQLGVETVMRSIETLSQWDGESKIGQLQDSSLATAAPRLTKSDGKIDFGRTAKQIVNQIRAFTPWPTSYCEWNHGKHPLRLIIHSAKVMQIETNAPPGVVVATDKKTLAIATSQHSLAVETIQPAGKNPMPIEDFLRGSSIQVGQTMNS